MENSAAGSWAIFFLSLVQMHKGVRITDLRVPSAVLNGSKGVELGCEYRLESGEDSREGSGLVVKWFLNSGAQPIYQWIVGRGKPRALGPMKGRLGRSKAGPNTMHVLHLTTDLAGEYRCHVSTFRAEDSKTKTMVVFVPEKTMGMIQRHPSGYGKTEFQCWVAGVYPEPKLIFYRNLQRTRVPLKKVKTEINMTGLVYDVSSKATLKDEELYSTTVVNCELQIPGTNYTKHKTSVYYPGNVLTWINDLEATSSVPDCNYKVSSVSFAMIVILNVWTRNTVF